MTESLPTHPLFAAPAQPDHSGSKFQPQAMQSSCCSLPDDAERAAKAALRFPCNFVIKAIGLKADDLREHVFNLVKKHDASLVSDRVTTRDSSKGKYLAVSVEVRAISREQLDAIYRDLHADSRILYVL